MHDSDHSSAETEGVDGPHGDSSAEPSHADAVGADEDVELLTSPIGRLSLHRFFVIGGPLGLAIAIVASLWVSFAHLRHSTVIQVQPSWERSERLAFRAQIVTEQPGPILGASAEVWVGQGTQRWDLPDPAAVNDSGVLQMTFEVPAALRPGPARVHVSLEAEPDVRLDEAFEVDVVQEREPVEPAPTISTSTLQHGDDTEAQPETMRLDVRVVGRLLAGFENRLAVRVLHPDGRPYRGEVQTSLVDGEFAQTRGGREPVVLDRGPTDALGLRWLEGRLDTEVLRLEVKLVDGPPGPRTRTGGPAEIRRRFRMVSYPGAVRVEVEPDVVRPSSTIELRGVALTARRPIFVDVYGPDGAWIDTVTPPFDGREPPRPWSWPEASAGLLHVEAYQFTNAPGESAAVRRVQVVQDDPAAASTLQPLIAEQRRRLDVPRVEKGFDAELEKAYLDWIEKADSLDAAAIDSARTFLLGTLPVTVHNPPVALATRQRELDTLAQWQRRWTIGLRIFLLGGGGLFLAAMTWSMVRAHAKAAERTTRALEQLGERAEVGLAQDVARARKQALARGLGVVVVMAAGLVLTTIMLESLVWIF